jgi:predicted small integral membrane protein
MLRTWLLVLGICCSAIAAFPAAASAQLNCQGALVATARAPTLFLSWTGQIHNPMADCIEAEFGKVSGTVRYMTLTLDSEGGSLAATERVIATLGKIRRTHSLSTVVRHGRKCWSACVAVFLAGKQRIAALTSTWLFHEVGGSGSYALDRTRSDRMFNDYYVAAGVAEAWLKRLYLLIPHSDYWQTGQNLWEDKSGIITHPLDNLVPRGTERRKY